LRIFKSWWKLGSQQECAADEVEHPTVGVTGNQEQETDDGYCEETSFNWLEEDQDYSSVTDSLSGTTDELASSDTLPIRTLALDEDSAYTVEEDAGVDPYNTGRSNAAKL
jgi:hypothetical protein